MKQRRVPQRTCVGCGQVQPKRMMVRVVRTETGAVQVDPTGKQAGRGAYLCKNPDCWERAIQRSALNRALKIELPAEDRDRLLQHGRSYAGSQATTQSAPGVGQVSEGGSSL